MTELHGRYGVKGIALSGYGMEEDVRRSLEAGFERHLTKPVNLQALQSAIQETARGA
jgi:CheY-like chemotaxis protein